MRQALVAFLLGAAAFAVPSGAEVPRCAGDVEIPSAPIVRVEHNDVLVLADGRALSLIGIRLPNAAQDRAPQGFENQAYDALATLAVHHTLVAHAVWPKEDRYDRVRSQVFTQDGTWLQLDLLQRGLARVELSPDRGECYRELYDAEIAARNAKLGIWAEPAYQVRTPENVGADIGTFQIVMGTVLDTSMKDGRAYLNFGADWKTDFTVTISPEDMENFRRMGVDPLNYKGKLVRVRGIVQSENGPEIEVGNPKQIELLQ